MTSTLEDIRAHIVMPGSVVIFELPANTTREMVDTIRAQVQAVMPDTPCLFVGGGIHVSTATKGGE